MQTTLAVSEHQGLVTFLLVPPEGKPPTIDVALLDELNCRLRELAAAPGETRIRNCAVGDKIVPEHRCRPRLVVVASKSAKYFCAGANIQVLQTMTAETIGPWVRLGHEVLLKLEQLNIPVVAQVSGYALGGGLELALACDLIYADDTTIVGQTESKLGFLTGWGGSVRLVERVGTARAKQMFFTADLVPASEAKAIGIIDRLIPADELTGAIKALAEKVSANSGSSIAAFKRVLADEQAAARRRNRENEATLSATCLRDDDTRSRLAAFLAQRRAKKTQ